MSVDAVGNRPTAAFFDVDGTLVDGSIVHYYQYFMRRRLAPVVFSLWSIAFLLKCAFYLVLDRIDRRRFNVVFYRNYAGRPAQHFRAMSQDCFVDVMHPRIFADAWTCVETHRQNGDAVVLVTGSVDFVILPLAQALNATDLIAASLVERDGVFTGELDGPPIGAEEKARRTKELAARRGFDLARSHAYGDSSADLPMLECVGFPHAVNPDRRLLSTAEARGWPVHWWTRAKKHPGRGR